MVRLRTQAAAAALLAAVLVFVLSPAHIHAQTPSVTVSGAVSDVSGAPLGGATVDVIVAGRSIGSVVTTESGRYRLEIPADAAFDLQVRRSGFADFSARLSGSRREVTRDVTLQIGGLSDTLVVTAAAGEQSRAAVTESVSVTTRSDIEALGASSVADVLRFVPGLSVEASGREGAVTSVFARGGESDYNLVLIDGVRVNASGGGFDFSRISAGEIDRVEVVRGAQSALWGSDAMGSVVQIFTRRPEATGKPRAFGSVEGGTFDSWRADLGATGGLGRHVDYHAGVTHRRTDGAFQDILPQKDWFEQSTFDAGLGARLGPRASARTTLRVSRAQARSVGNITFGSRDTGGDYDSSDLSWHSEVSHTAGSRYTGTGSFNYYRYNVVSDDTVDDAPFDTYAVLEGTPGALFPDGTRLVRLIDRSEFNALSAGGAMPAPGQFLASTTSFDFPFENENKFRRPALRYQGDFMWANGQRLSAGYEWERETSPLVDEYQVDNNAFFVQQQSTIASRWFVTAGLRIDNRESYDTFVSPKLSAGGFILAPRRAAVSSLKVTGNIGKGIKSPSFAERFGDGFAQASPDLKVERARTADIGGEATFADEWIRAGVTYFDNAYRDQVAFQFFPVPMYVNIDGSKARGWEMEAGLQRAFHGVKISGTYALVDTEVVTTRSTSQQFQPGQPLLRRPKHSTTIRGSYAVWRAVVHGDIRFIGDRHDSSFLFLQTVPNAAMPTATFTDITVNPGYTVVGLGVDVRLDRALTAYVRVNNIADTTYDAVIGYPGLPRTVMAGARFEIGK